ncbi:hypothetical protein OMR07_12495 [Methylobacterium organophilum]|nr:hypothetical protein [Methylobacterium organophilum]
MTDDETLLLLSAYADGELSPGEVLAMERRLAADPDARALAERLRNLSGTLRETLAGPPAPESLRARVVEQVGFSDPPPSRGRFGGALGSWPETWIESWLKSWRGSRQALAATLLVGLVGGAALGGGAVYLDRPGGAPDTGAVQEMGPPVPVGHRQPLLEMLSQETERRLHEGRVREGRGGAGLGPPLRRGADLGSCFGSAGVQV